MEPKLCVRLMLPQSNFCLSFEGLHQLHCPTCSLKEEPQKGWTNTLPFSESHTKSISSISPPFTHAHTFKFNYTDFSFSHCCSTIRRKSEGKRFLGEHFLIWETLKYFGDAALCISIKRIKGENMSGLCSWETKYWQWRM